MTTRDTRVDKGNADFPGSTSPEEEGQREYEAWRARQQRDDCDPFCMAPFGSHHKRCGA